MSFYTEKITDVIVETIDINHATFKEAEEFKKKIENQFENGYKKFIIDLSKCNFMDSTFLSTIVTVLKKVSKAGGNLKLAGVHAEAQALLELTGTAKIFEIYKTKEEAVKSYKTKAA